MGNRLRQIAVLKCTGNAWLHTAAPGAALEPYEGDGLEPGVDDVYQDK